MKKFICCMLFLAATGILFGQCIIYMKNGEKIAARTIIAPPSSDQLKYKTPDKKNMSVKKSDVLVITRGKQLLVVNDRGMLVGGKTFKGMPSLDTKSACVDGALGALNNYKVGGTAIGMGIVSFLVWPVGIITTAVVTSIPPAERNLNIPASANKSDNQYMDCYKKEARKKRNQSAWMFCSFGTCMGIALTSLIFIL